MYGYYLLIKGIDSLTKSECEIFKELLDELLLSPSYEIKDNVLIIIDKQKTDISWAEFIRNTNSDFYSDLRLYESNSFHSHQALSLNLNETIKKDILPNIILMIKFYFMMRFINILVKSLKRNF